MLKKSGTQTPPYKIPIHKKVLNEEKYYYNVLLFIQIITTSDLKLLLANFLLSILLVQGRRPEGRKDGRKKGRK